MSFLQSLISPFSSFLSEDPSVATTQVGLMAMVVVVLFLLFYTLKDVLLRTHSFLYQCVCILLVAFLPFVGFLLYLLIRPARTVKQREMERMLRALHDEVFGEVEIEEMADEVETEDEDEDEEDDEEDEVEKKGKKGHSKRHS